jgi:hypothetical protein
MISVVRIPVYNRKGELVDYREIVRFEFNNEVLVSH